jgi:signal transduction histidine kinase
MPAPPPEARLTAAALAKLRSLKVKFVAATLVMVGVVFGLSTWWNLQVHYGHMVRATEDKIRALADSIDRRIYTAMREGHRHDISRILEDASHDPDIERIVLISPQGDIRQASRPELVGRRLDRVRLLRYLDQPETVVSGHLEDGQPIRSIVRKIRNGTECHGCHGSTAEVNGILHLDMSLLQTQAQIAEMELSAIWTVVIVGLVLSTAGALLMVRMVDRPLARLTTAMARVETGDLSVRAHHGSRDEIGRLAESFNTMVERLQAAREEIEAYHRQRLAHSERLASMGELAASLAHEIKNPLAGIDGAVQVMADELPETDPRKEILLEILNQVRRLDKTVRDLLAFARPGRPDVAPCNLHQVLDRTLLLLAGDPEAKRMRVVRNYRPDLPPLAADGKQLGQVFLNLILNAVQAAPAGGPVTIRTDVRSGGGAEPLVTVEVADCGPGIPAHLREEIFKPFVTTKHRGTGLGLSVSRRIVEEHGGSIEVESPQAGGAVFRVLLPLAGRRAGVESAEA